MITSDPRTRTSESYAGMTAATIDEIAGRHVDRLTLDTMTTASATEESLVVDDRSALRPAQAVEHKLSRMLLGGSVPVSHLQSRSILRAR